MTNNVEQELKNIRTQISSAQERATRAKVRKEQAEERLTEAQDKLKSSFQVESIEAGKELVAKLQTKLSQQLEEAKQALAKVNDD